MLRETFVLILALVAATYSTQNSGLCPKGGSPQKLDNSTGLEILKDWCPKLAVPNPDTGLIETCCDTQDLIEMDGRLRMDASVFGPCIECLVLQRDYECKTTCSPKTEP